MKMVCIYLSLGFFVAGICAWIAGSRFEKRKATQSKAKRKKYQELSEKAALIARVLFVLCALAFVLGFILIQNEPMLAPLAP